MRQNEDLTHFDDWYNVAPPPVQCCDTFHFLCLKGEIKHLTNTQNEISPPIWHDKSVVNQVCNRVGGLKGRSRFNCWSFTHLNVLFNTGLIDALWDCYNSSLCLPPANTTSGNIQVLCMLPKIELGLRVRHQDFWFFLLKWNTDIRTYWGNSTAVKFRFKKSIKVFFFFFLL